MIRPGEEWGSPADSPPDLELAGGDAELAHAVAAAPGALIRFLPDSTSDLARAVGLGPGAPPALPTTAVPLDALVLDDSLLACNLCALGTPPDRLRWTSPGVELEIEIDGRPWFSGRATTIVVATGQFLRGLDLVPRGHPGDGRAEVQVYELGRRERRVMRARLATGSHVPHPRIRQRSARTVTVRSDPAAPCEVDGVTRAPVGQLTISVVAGAYRLLV